MLDFKKSLMARFPLRIIGKHVQLPKDVLPISVIECCPLPEYARVKYWVLRQIYVQSDSVI